MIDTQAIRSKILDLAMRGQLTEQLPEDGNAEELYQQILEEKQKLIKEGKIKKQKPLPKINDEEIPFDIPDNWKWVRLGELTSIISKGTTPRGGNAFYVEKGIGFLRAENLKGYDKLSLNNLKYVDEKTHLGFLKRSILDDGDILISIAGTLGRTGMVRKENLPLNTNQAVAFIRVANKKHIDLRYLVFTLNANTIQKMMDYKKVEMAIPNLSLSVISNVIIPLPPLNEQERIVEKIEQVFSILDTIDELQAQYADNLTALKSKLIDAAIQGKITEQLPEDGTAEKLYQQIQTEKNRLSQIGKTYREKGIKVISDNDIPYDIPDTWRWVRLGDLTTVITKGSSPSWQGVSYTSKEEGILFVTSENVGNGKMILSKKKYIEPKFNDMHPASILIKGDILTNLVGASIGRTAVYNEDIDNANINQAVCIIRLVEREITDYLLLYLGSTTAIDKMLHGSVDFARANLSLTSVSNLMIPLPPLAEQKRIVQKLNEILPLCEIKK